VNLCATGLRYVLAAERLPCAVEIVPWGHGLLRWHADLTDVANRDAQARLIAARIRDHKADRPGDPVFLVAKSGGAGVVVKALELLGHEEVERAVLLAPALSPGYDLTGALGGVRHEIVVFWSPLDFIILGVGTRIFGTTDRKRTASAGLVGFRSPSRESLDAAGGQLYNRHGGPFEKPHGSPYDKLHQVRWHRRMAATAHFGGHWGPDSPVFLRKYVAPLLRTRETAPC
jgi:hypothetical protein